MIAAHIVPLIPDGAVLQIGIGTLPNAVLSGLVGHRNLGIHSGVIGDSVLTELIERGVVNNSTKHVDRGISVTGALFGTSRLFAYANKNPELRVEPVEYTHNLSRLSAIDSFVTLNAALEVDLTGQINGESAGREYLGTIGGQTDFIRGALASPRGRSIVALPSLADKSGISRIVAQIGTGVTTTSRADADVFVTEYGVAEVRGCTIRDRVTKLIRISHPEKREALEIEARSRIAGYR
jgi:acetyl-CoA hydrolase